MKLSELKIIVTGGASGMGACFARHLSEAGARVAVGDVNEALLSELPQGIARRKLDVSKEDDVASFVAWADEVLGGVNALVNNAGDQPLAGQQVGHVADVAAAQRVGLAGQAERAAAGLADLAEHQVEVDDRVAGERAQRRLVDAHCPERQE